LQVLNSKKTTPAYIFSELFYKPQPPALRLWSTNTVDWIGFPRRKVHSLLTLAKSASIENSACYRNHIEPRQGETIISVILERSRMQQIQGEMAYVREKNRQGNIREAVLNHDSIMQ
jgi:hypothetical protein